MAKDRPGRVRGPIKNKKGTEMMHELSQLAINRIGMLLIAALTDLASSGPFTVRMSMYGGFEQVGSLGTSLPENDVRTTTQAGDIVLYAGSRIVIFYGSNSWAYTRLGRITDKTARELAELLGSGDVSVTLTVS